MSLKLYVTTWYVSVKFGNYSLHTGFCFAKSMVVDHKMAKLYKTRNQALQLGSRIQDMEAYLIYW